MTAAIVGYAIGALLAVMLSCSGDFVPPTFLGRVLFFVFWPVGLALALIVWIVSWFWNGDAL